MGVLFGFGNSLPQIASAAPRCAPAASAQSDVVGVMQNLFAALRADDLKRPRSEYVRLRAMSCYCAA
jgi:hypothetical protein